MRSVTCARRSRGDHAEIMRRLGGDRSHRAGESEEDDADEKRVDEVAPVEDVHLARRLKAVARTHRVQYHGKVSSAPKGGGARGGLGVGSALCVALPCAREEYALRVAVDVVEGLPAVAAARVGEPHARGAGARPRDELLDGGDLCHTCGAWGRQCTWGKVHGVGVHTAWPRRRPWRSPWGW